MKNILIKQACIINKNSKHHQQIVDVLITSGSIAKINKNISEFPSDSIIIAGTDLHASVGWMDIRSNLNDHDVPGLYFYNNKVVEYAKTLKPSARGELEISDLNLKYLDRGELTAIKFARGAAWLDAGSAETLFESSAYVHSIQSRQGIKIGCIEEECYKRKLINKAQLQILIGKMPESGYKQYLIKLL